MVPKPVKFVEKVSGAVGDAVVRCQEEGSLVVLEDLGSNGGMEWAKSLNRMLIGVMTDLKMSHSLNQHTFQGEECLQSVRESGVFGFESGTGDGGLELGLPNQGEAAQHDNVSSS